MAGFSQSFNVSVTAAVCLHELTNRLRRSGVDWALPQSERDDLRLAWLANEGKQARVLVGEAIGCASKNVSGSG
jgi:tRNA (guanosine-2'-O-)-methyltransferase